MTGLGMGHGDGYGFTPLMWAARNGHLDTVEALVDAGASLDLQEKYGKTAIDQATYHDNPAVVRLLVGRGADQTVKNGDLA